MKQIMMLALMLSCAACGGEVKETLGLNREAPDEFRVVARPPLSVPKDFYLYPPGEARDYAANRTTQDARSLIFSGARPYAPDATLESLQAGLAESAAPVVKSSALPTQGEDSLLARIGANEAPSDIRAQLDAEYEAKDDEAKGVLERLRNQESGGEHIVDAAKERERLQEAAKAGEAVNEGEVPTITKRESVLDRLF